MQPSAPPPVPPDQDNEHLDLLATFHYIVAGLGALFACLPLLHVGMGVMMITRQEMFNQGAPNAQPPPAFFGYMFVVMGAMFALLGWCSAICTFVSGRHIKRRRKRIFSLIIAGLLCMFFPFGTILGVFTLVVLGRESVKQIYMQQK